MKEISREDNKKTQPVQETKPEKLGARIGSHDEAKSKTLPDSKAGQGMTWD